MGVHSQGVPAEESSSLPLNSELALLASSEVEGLKEGWKALGMPPVQQPPSLQLTASKPSGW